MGICVHEAAAIEKLDKWVSEPTGAQTIYEYSRKLRDGDWWSGEYRDAIGQPHFATRDWPMHQVAAFAWVHTVIGKGQVAQIDIGLGHSPAPDRARRDNSEMLRDLPHPFIGHVSLTQNHGDCDGRLEWSEPVIADVVTGRGKDGAPSVDEIILPPDDVPLEVGSTLPSRTAMHLVQDQAVARWAFGRDALRVLVWVDEPMSHKLARRFESEFLRDAEPLPQEGTSE